MFDNRSSASGRSDALSMALGLGSGFATGTYGDYLAYGQRIGVGNEVKFILYTLITHTYIYNNIFIYCASVNTTLHLKCYSDGL